MEKINQKTVVAVAVAAIVSGGIGAAVILGSGTKRSIRAYNCGTDKEIEYIVASGPEYIIVNPRNEWGRNSFLVSRQVSTTPKDWLIFGIPVRNSTEAGFELEDSKPSRHIKKIVFNSETGVLSVDYDMKGPKDWSIACKPETNISKLLTAANNAPIEYLMGRSNNISFFNPSLGQKDFNLSLYDSIKQKEHSTYSIYQLLSGLPETTLTGDQSLAMKDAREKLIKENSREVEVWTYAGTGRYAPEPQFPNENEVARELSIEWCNDQEYSKLADYTSKGYQVASSGSQSRSSGGYVRHEYPDGRYGGYVNFTADCDGTMYKLKKTGGVDSEDQNMAIDYD